MDPRPRTRAWRVFDFARIVFADLLVGFSACAGVDGGGDCDSNVETGIAEGRDGVDGVAVVIVGDGGDLTVQLLLLNDCGSRCLSLCFNFCPCGCINHEFLSIYGEKKRRKMVYNADCVSFITSD